MRRDEDRSVGRFFHSFFLSSSQNTHAHNLIIVIRQPLVPFHTLFAWSRSMPTKEKIEIIAHTFFRLLLCTLFVYANENLLYGMKLCDVATTPNLFVSFLLFRNKYYTFDIYCIDWFWSVAKRQLKRFHQVCLCFRYTENVAVNLHAMPKI